MNPEMVVVKRKHISSEIREYILRRDGYRCRYCGSKNPPFHLDHVYPVAKGGETTINNLVTACEDCNYQKHDKVGIYPKPVGYFDNHVEMNYMKIWKGFIAFMLDLFILSVSISDILSGNLVPGIIEGTFCLVIAILLSVTNVYDYVKMIKGD